MLRRMFQAFPLGPFLIWTQLVFLLIGVWLSTEFFLRLALSAHLSLQHFQEQAVRYLAAFLFCGRLFAIVSQYSTYVRDPLRVFIIWDGGFTFLGGMIGIAALIFWETRTHRATFLQWLDVLLPTATFGMAFHWLGRFFSGYGFGKPTDVFWGVSYDAPNVSFTVPLHPVQLYYSLFYFFLTFLLLIIRKNAKHAGTETLSGIFFASMSTFFFEFFRGDPTIKVFATGWDLLVLLSLFISLGVFAAVELRLSRRALYLYQGALLLVFGSYLLARPILNHLPYELRFSQFLAILALLATVVYVIVHRRKYPHL